MKLSTIWTLQSLSTMERLRRTKELGVVKIASSLPVSITYWVTVQQLAKATVGSPNVMATTVEEVIDNLDSPYKHK